MQQYQKVIWRIKEEAKKKAKQICKHFKMTIELKWKVLISQAPAG